MNVMVSGVVRRDLLQRVPRELIATVVVDCLYCGHGEEPHALTSGHAGGQECHTGAGGIQQETFNRVVVQSTKSIWNVKAMVARVEFN